MLLGSVFVAVVQAASRGLQTIGQFTACGTSNAPGTIVVNNMCMQCPLNCTSCTWTGGQIDCQGGCSNAFTSSSASLPHPYFPSTQTTASGVSIKLCLQCPDGCAACTNVTTSNLNQVMCTSCMPGYYMNFTGGIGAGACVMTGKKSFYDNGIIGIYVGCLAFFIIVLIIVIVLIVKGAKGGAFKPVGQPIWQKAPAK